MVVVFDSKDVDYLIHQFTVPDLRSEINSALTKLRGESDPFLQLYYRDYIDTCRLAINIMAPVTHQQHNNIKPEIISVDEIKSKHDLVDYIGQYVNLRKSGNKFQGLCPFHADKKSPSFFVYPNNTFHCFGCQAHGTIIDFVMRYDNLDFKSALYKLG